LFIVLCIYFWLKQLTFTEADQEGTETIETLRIPLDEAVQMVMDNKITHAPSCVLILKAHNRSSLSTDSGN
jgi:energy-coupling factor transporter transmembrane protein EcfT